MPGALDKDLKTLDKDFAECNTRHSAHGIYSIDEQLFAECFLSRTRQMVCREFKFDTRQKSGLPSVFGITLGKGLLFADCFWNYTRQTYFLFFSQHTIIVC